MTTQERLFGYNPNFSPEVVDSVFALAEWQQAIDSYHNFFSHMGAEETQKLQYQGYNPTEILDIRPGDEVPHQALVYHLPMANPLDPNMIYQAATIAKANPGKRLIAIGNPSGPGYNGGTLNAQHREQVANGDLRPVVEPLLKYLDDELVWEVDHIGYSYGVDTATTAIAHGDQDTKHAVLLEPASVLPRSMPKLGSAFMSTNKHLQKYVDATGLESFKEARKDSVGPITYPLGLARVTNLAIAKGLARGGFESRLTEARKEQTSMTTSLIWGSESELAIDGIVRVSAKRLALYKRMGEFRTTRLEGQYHALANDVHLQAAVVLEGLK